MTPPALAALLVGRTLADRYEIEEMIGRGGMSLVYRARDRRLHRPVAVKIISIPASDDGEHRTLRERLRREAAAAARVPPHPNVVQVYDYGTDTALDLDFIAMELLSGRNLREVLNERPPAFAEATRIVREAARGLAAGHRAGIVHRDVKPPNIVVTDEAAPGNVKLLDFGIAKVLEEAQDDDLTRTGHAPHSPAYASPEQRLAGSPVTAASDVYQLALVAREMLTGSRELHGEEARRRWMDLSPPLRAVLERALRSAPAERYPDAAAFAEAFSAALDGTAAAAAAAPPLPTAPISTPVPPPAEEEATRAFDAAEMDDPEEDQNVRATGPDLPPLAHQWGATPGEPGMGPEPALRRSSALHRGALALGAVLAILVVLRLLTFTGSDPISTSAPLATDTEALEEEFRDLFREASRNLREDPHALPEAYR